MLLTKVQFEIFELLSFRILRGGGGNFTFTTVTYRQTKVCKLSRKGAILERKEVNPEIVLKVYRVL